MFATCPHSKLIANRSIIINGLTGTNNLFDLFPINQCFPLFFCLMSARIVGVTAGRSIFWLENEISVIPKVPWYKKLPTQVSETSFNTLYAPLPPCLGEGRGEKYSQPVPPYFNELLGILQVGWVFWNFILIGRQCFKFNLFICFVRPQKTSKQPIIGNSQSRRKGAPWKIWARPKQSRFEDFKQLITNCRKYMNGVAHRRNGSEFKLIYAVLI